MHRYLAGCLTALASLLAVMPLSAKPGDTVVTAPRPAAFADLRMAGELQQRLLRNLGRLQEQKYRPANVFLTEEQSGGWPGDTEGRAMLGLTLEAQATHRIPETLDSIVALVPEHLNDRGYMGPIYDPVMNEQQLAGNGWMLRALCEYWQWKKDPAVRDIIASIAHNLFVAGRGKYATYPVDPATREAGKGGAMGNLEATVDGWMLSSDVGCLFLGMDGLIHAYEVLGDTALQPVIEEMLERFVQMPLLATRAQTHSSLTACRAMLRYASLTGDQRWVRETQRVFDLYLSDGMTENYENYNWMRRYDTWTEPCAIVDSYMTAHQLWQATLDPRYRDLAESIYYNGLCTTQHANGGFGLDNCPGTASGTPFLRVRNDEAHWCCTMRGGEGLSRVAQCTYCTAGDTAYVTQLNNSSVRLGLAGGELALSQFTDYPYEGLTALRVDGNTAGNAVIRLCLPSWTSNPRLRVNGVEETADTLKGFVTVERPWNKGDEIILAFDVQQGERPTRNADNSAHWNRLLYYGPLLLGTSGTDEQTLPPDARLRRTGRAQWQVEGTDIIVTPLYHLMDPAVNVASGYSRQAVFSNSQAK